MTTLYAQADGNYTTGAWSAADLWNTAANGSGSDETPTSADTLVSNAFTITIADNLTVVKVTNTGGGTFALSNGITLTCTDGTAGVVGDASDLGAITFDLASPNTAILAAKVKGGNGSKEWGVNFSGTGQLTINGSVTGGSFAGAVDTGSDGVYMSGSGTLIVSNGTSTALSGGSEAYARGVYCTASSGATITVTGNATGGGGNSSYGLYSTGAATITVTGNLTGSNSANDSCCLYSTGAATITVIGNVTGSGGSRSYGLGSTGAATITVIGNVTGGSNIYGSSSYGLGSTGAATITIAGNVTGGNSSNGAYGIGSTGAATITITGNVTGGNTSSYGLYIGNASAPTSIIGECIASVGANAVYSIGETLTVTGPLKTNFSGKQALYCPNWNWNSSALSSTYIEVYTSDNVKRSLYTADTIGGNPAVDDVRYGTTYGPSSELTGTCHVPAAASVLYGVSVDATTGTATLTAADIRAAMGLASANLDTQLATKPSIDVVGGIVAALGV